MTPMTPQQEARFLELSTSTFQQTVLGALVLLLAHAHRMEKRYGETEYAAALMTAAKKMYIIMDPEHAPD